MMRVASIDLKKIERLRETGDYQRLKELLPGYRKSGDLFNEKIIVIRICAAEIAAHEGNIPALRDAIEPYLDRLKSVPFDLVGRVMILGAVYYSQCGQTDDAIHLVTIAGDIALAREDDLLHSDALHCEGE